MAFEIKDNEGNDISISELDREVAEFWGKRYSQEGLRSILHN
jgi:hypothetical protein